MTVKNYAGRAAESLSYNIRGWLTGIQSPYFTQTLHYTDGTGTPCYNGNISSMSWKSGSDVSVRGYKFSYDGLSRLKNAVYGEGSTLATNINRFSEQVTGYDRMGNILGLKRYGQTTASAYGLVDNLNLSYNGNQLISANDNATSSVYGTGMEFKDGVRQTLEYEYDKNGNLTKDFNKKITSIRYNCLNLPDKLQLDGGNSISNLYGSDGTKLRATRFINGKTTTTDYCGNAIYENGVLSKVLTEDGYITAQDNKAHYFIQDHQGNTRVVVDNGGKVEELTHYYPFGGIFSSINNVQPYKYNGKELDRSGGLDWYDYGARMYDAAIGRWHVVDPMAEKYYRESLYVYCGNNPIVFVDPSGMDYWSTNDPNEIDRFMSTRYSFASGNFMESFNFSSWNHSADNDFTASLTYNDDKNVFYSSYSTVIDGEFTLIGISIPALRCDHNSACIEGSRSKWYKKSSGRLENTYPEFNLLFLTTKSGFNLAKGILTSMFRSFSTVNTVNANKSGFVHGGSNKEKMGKAKGNMSGNHKVQNAQIDNLCTKYKLGKKQRDTVHEMITGEGYGYHEVEQLIKEYFNK